jgi:hypothetical protein
MGDTDDAGAIVALFIVDKSARWFAVVSKKDTMLINIEVLSNFGTYSKI